MTTKEQKAETRVDESRSANSPTGSTAPANGAVLSLAVFRCIAAISGKLAQSGISKDRKNQQQGYAFRGIDDVYNALAPMLAAEKLVIVPRILSRVVVERATQKGGVLFNVTVEAEFDFIAAEDGSKVTARTYGEAMDSADKATNKAMSAAYKYAAFQTFCIPTEGDNDADAHTPEPVRATVPDGFDNWLADLEAVAEEGTPALERAWKGSQPYLRKHLTDTNKAKWDSIKLRAARATVTPAEAVPA
jgi:hypothetical protein